MKIVSISALPNPSFIFGRGEASESASRGPKIDFSEKFAVRSIALFLQNLDGLQST